MQVVNHTSEDTWGQVLNRGDCGRTNNIMPSKLCDRLMTRTKLYFLRIDKLRQHNFLIIADSWTAVQRLGCEHVHLPSRWTRRSPPDGEQTNGPKGTGCAVNITCIYLILADSWTTIQSLGCEHVHVPSRWTRRSPPDGEQTNGWNGADSNAIMIIVSSRNEVSWKTEPMRCI